MMAHRDKTQHNNMQNKGSFLHFSKNLFSGLLLLVMKYAFSLHFLFVSVFINCAVIMRKVTGLK